MVGWANGGSVDALKLEQAIRNLACVVISKSCFGDLTLIEEGWC